MASTSRNKCARRSSSNSGGSACISGGLKVYTTIDLDMQKAAELQVAESLEEIERRRARAQEQRLHSVKGMPAPRPAGPPLQAALVAMDPLTGQVRAMVGGRNFEQSHFNRAMQAKRQPGSAFKPFVFAAALEAGYTPASLIERLDEPVMTLQGEWTPEDEHSDADAMTLRTALRTSSNRAAVRMLEDVGIAKTVTYAKALGRRLCAERSLAGAGVRRSDADGDDRRLRRVREQGHAAAVRSSFAGSRISRARCCSRARRHRSAW